MTDQLPSPVVDTGWPSACLPAPDLEASTRFYRAIGFEVLDECYRGLDISSDVRVVATASDGEPAVPACWTRTEDRGRVATSILGHDRRSLDHPRHRDLLGDLVEWLLEGRS